MPRSARLLIGAVLPLFSLLGDGSQARLISCPLSVVANGGFDSDLADWSAVQGFGSARWESLDAGGARLSGSVLLVNNSKVAGQTAEIFQCRSVTPNISYDLSAWAQPHFLSPESVRQPRHDAYGYFYVLVNFYTQASCAGAPLSDYMILDYNNYTSWAQLSQSFYTPRTAASASVTLGVFKNLAIGDLSCNFDEVSLSVSGSSLPQDSETLCFGQGRFQARARWTTPDGRTGAAEAVRLSSDTGYLWFFNPNNIEMLVKVLDGCGTNSSYWVFAGGLTDVDVVLTVTDALTGATRTYRNPQGTAFLPIQDTSAFGACASSPAPPSRAASRTSNGPARPSPATVASGCSPDSETLCVGDGRFAVSTQWTTSDGRTGFGTPVPLTSDTGSFWFFSPTNVEIIVKVLDGCGVDSSFWVFAAGLTDVNVLMTVTDTQTGAVRTYTNPQGTAFLPIQDTAAFAACR